MNSNPKAQPIDPVQLSSIPDTIGLIAGNGSFPLRFVEEAKRNNRRTVVVAHREETNSDIENLADYCEWIKVGELGKIISVFKQQNVSVVAMAGGINRVKLFGGVKLDVRGAALLMKLRSTKDDVIMRGIARELESEGIRVVESTVFLTEHLVPQTILTKSRPSTEELEDILVGVNALKAMADQHIGQLVVVKEGVVVAVEAVEGSDSAIQRGGTLGGPGSVVVKFAKPSQDIRFDIPVVGKKTIETMIAVKARVLAVEAGRCLLMDGEETLALANYNTICIIGCAPLVKRLTPISDSTLTGTPVRESESS